MGGQGEIDTPSHNVRDHVIDKSCGRMQVSGVHETAVGGRVVFCVVVAKVGVTRFPVDK